MAEAMRVGGRRWDIRLKTGLEISFPEDAELDRALLAVFELNEATGVLDEGSDVKRIDARDPDHFAVGLGVVRADIKQEAGGA
jgi:cell division protein FtsQ